MCCQRIETSEGPAIICRVRTDDEIALSLLGPEPSDDDMAEEQRAEEARMLEQEVQAEASMSDLDRARLQLLVGLGYLDVDLDPDCDPDFDDHDLDEDGLPASGHESFSWPLGMSIIPAIQAVPGNHGFVGMPWDGDDQ